ncbi:MAG: D-alanine--D-alanine ligase, partial [Janibacter sp.]|nr:D-alanine--D-alanine ligase [Janibacter sp.]
MSSHPSRKPRVAVVFGGRSSEHAVSCATAAGVLRAIDRDVYDVVPVGITRDGAWVLAPDDADALTLTAERTPEVADTGAEVILPTRVGRSELSIHRPGAALEALGEVDVVFPLLHGPYGEDGTLQGMLELTDIRYVGSGVLASAAGMDKHYMKVVFVGAGLPVGPYTVITDTQWRRDKAAAMDAVGALTYPVFVKPCRAGSSMGVSKVDGPEGLEAAIDAAREHDLKVIVESGIVGREIECAVLQGRGLDAPRTSMPGEIVVEAGHGHDFYDFEAKYLDEA